MALLMRSWSLLYFQEICSPFCNDGGQGLVHSWEACDRPLVFRVLGVFELWYQESHTLGQPLWGLFWVLEDVVVGIGKLGV